MGGAFVWFSMIFWFIYRGLLSVDGVEGGLEGGRKVYDAETLMESIVLGGGCGPARLRVSRRSLSLIVYILIWGSMALKCVG